MYTSRIARALFGFGFVCVHVFVGAGCGGSAVDDLAGSPDGGGGLLDAAAERRADVASPVVVDAFFPSGDRPRIDAQPVDGSACNPADPTAPAGSPVAVHGQLQVQGTLLVDACGEPVQLKGASSMWLNWESAPFPESKSALGYARDNWKLSVIRASMGTEASRGYLTGDAAKTAMLAKVETIIQNALALGIYVLVDWHTEKAVDQQADAVAFFSGLAQKYGQYPNVIWEPYNEPNGYTWAQIKPYHEAVVDAIRAIDPDNVIVMGTPRWSQDVDVASQDPVAPARGARNLMYTLHFYACTHKQSLRDKANYAIGKGLALFVTEFGATPADGGVVSKGDPYVCREETNTWWNWMSANNISGVSWKLDKCSDTSCILTSDAPVDGPWTDQYLTSDLGNTYVSAGVSQGGGHGLYVVSWMRE
jgi:endoglucanase